MKIKIKKSNRVAIREKRKKIKSRNIMILKIIYIYFVFWTRCK